MGGGTDRQARSGMKQQSSEENSHNTFVDHLIQYRISSLPKTVKKRNFCTGVKDIPTDGRIDPLLEMRF